MIIVHAGNRVDSVCRVKPRFPAVNEAAVRRALVEELRRLRPRRVVSAAAAGADLLMLEAADGLDIDTTIVLPLLVKDFRRRSVDDLGQSWIERFALSMDLADQVLAFDLSAHEDWYLLGNGVLLEHALKMGNPGEEILAIVVSDLEVDRGSATASFSATATGKGLEVISIDPLNPEQVR